MYKNLFRISVLTGAVLAASGAMAVTATFTGAGTPIAIPDNGNASSTATAAGPAGAASITDVNLNVNITHTWSGDVGLTLAATNPVVAPVAIVANCGTSGDYTGAITFDDAAAAPLACVAATNIATGTFQSPNGATVMAAFNGSAAAGPVTWTLNVADDSAICTGTLNSFSVTVTSDVPVPVELRNFSID
ncbi:MAG: hypothetical protein ABI411_03660 [Tahibacter sp.]